MKARTLLGKRPALAVEGVAVAFLVPARCGQVVFDGGLKGLFCVIGWHSSTHNLR